MKKDLDALMHAHELDALLVMGPGQHNADMVYLTGGGHLTSAELIKVRDGQTVLFYSPMERDEAAKSGLATRNLQDYNYKKLLEEAGGSAPKALALRYQRMLADAGIEKGRVGVYGKVSIGPVFAVLSELQALAPGLTLVGETGNNVLLKARATKEAAEIERMRRMGQITTQVVGQVADFLSSHKAKNEVLVKKDGQPLTIADVKSKINLWLVEKGAENPEGTIFAIGRDAGVPHSSGSPDDTLKLGQTIVFDIFPCEQGGGYYYDFTRTWCLGYAPDRAASLYDDVYSAYKQIMSELKADMPCVDYDKRVSRIFEQQGHATIESNPDTQEGYVHSLGHGLGLNVHEAPWFRSTADADNRLEPGVVVTIEPGLYYPDHGLGCRLEDTVWVRPDGAMEILAEYPLDLILPVKE